MGYTSNKYKYFSLAVGPWLSERTRALPVEGCRFDSWCPAKGMFVKPLARDLGELPLVRVDDIDLGNFYIRKLSMPFPVVSCSRGLYRPTVFISASPSVL